VFGQQLTRLSLTVLEQIAPASSFCTLLDIHVSLPQLTYMRLGGYVNHIETHALERMPCLEVLILEGSMWKTSDPPQWVFHLPTSIRHLRVWPIVMGMGIPAIIRYCTVAPYVRALTNLQALDFANVSGLRLSEWQVPFSCHLTGLTSVQLADFFLQAIPPCVASLSTLKYLNVSGNSLHELPVAPYLSCLDTLRAAYCEITAFPLEAVSRATALEILRSCPYLETALNGPTRPMRLSKT
jgi:hypothetical protein